MRFTNALLLRSVITMSKAAASSSECRDGFTICQPIAATTSETPQIGDEKFLTLYTNLLQSSLPTFDQKLSSFPFSSRDSPSLCCISTLSCLTVANLALPFCYDKYTTNYFLPDNSYGTLVGGSYTSSSGNTANLQTGDYILKDGREGNLYSDDSAARPIIATLSIPSQWTGTGVGSAIPASELGGRITRTFMTTLPGTTIPGTTFPTQIITITASGSVATTTLEASSRAGTAIEPVVMTVTTTEVALASSSLGASKTAGSSSKGVPWFSFFLGFVIVVTCLL